MTGGGQAVILGTGVIGLFLSLAGLVGLLRWRRRNASLVDQVPSPLTRVSRALRRGQTVPDQDRAVGVLVTEQLALLTLILLSPLLLAVGQVIRAVVQPDGSSAVVLVMFGFSFVVSVAGLALCCRGLLMARRQGIRPERLW